MEERLYDVYALEEDIKILTEEYPTHKKEEAIEHLIEAYRKVEKENKELLEVKISATAHNRIIALEQENADLKNLANNKQWISPCYVAQNYIPKSKIKEKIEEYKQEADEETNIEAFNKIDALEELLEEE